MSSVPDAAAPDPTLSELLAELAETFGLDQIDPTSLTSWSRVFRARVDSRDVVVKRTPGTAERAAAMATWLRELAAAGLAVVTPVDLDRPNPAPIRAGEDAEWWVVYPFVEGRVGVGVADAEAAGDFLGRMHAMPLSAASAAALRPYAWTTTDPDEIAEELAELRTILTKQLGPDAPAAIASVEALADRWWTSSLPELRAADARGELVRAGVSSDYKASNLVFTGAGPVLVDPDNGGVEPRIFDLALAVALFHTAAEVPGRLFTAAEWQAFLAGYRRHVELTEAEQRLWPAALDHMLWEEGTWALADADDDDSTSGWHHALQGPFLHALALAKAEDFPL